MAELSRSLQHVNCPCRESTWDTLICLFQGGGNFSLFSSSRRSLQTHRRAPKWRLRHNLDCAENTRTHADPGRCLPVTTPEIEHQSPGLINRRQIPQRSREKQSRVPPLPDLQVRRVSSSALRNARTVCCKTPGKFLANTHYAKQTCALMWFNSREKIRRDYLFFYYYLFIIFCYGRHGFRTGLLLMHAKNASSSHCTIKSQNMQRHLDILFTWQGASCQDIMQTCSLSSEWD